MRRTKQVIVMRRYFPDGNGGRKKVRTGKYIAQGAHASMAAILNEMSRTDDTGFVNLTLKMKSKSSLYEWLNGGFAKITTYVDTEEELLALYDRAKAAGLRCALITDSGRTEFGGVPTNTCIAIGPDYAENIDPITKNLKLM